MINATKKNISIIYSTCFVLFIFYILSITAFSSKNGKNNKKHIVKYSFITKEEIPQINGFEIVDYSNILNQTDTGANSWLYFTKKDNVWLVSPKNNQENLIPADTNQINKLFNFLSNTNKVNLISNKIADDNSYGLDDNTQTYIIINGNSFSREFIFGNYDFSQANKYFSEYPIKSVYSVDSQINNFLTASTQNWADPYLISEQLKNSVYKMGDLQSIKIKTDENITKKIDNTIENWNEISTKIFELRHGGINLTKIDSDPIFSLYLEMGNKSDINIDIFANANLENEFIVRTTFSSEMLNQSFSYETTISLWTYNKIKEMML